MRISISLSLVLLGSLPAAPSAETTQPLRFALLNDRTIIVPVTINGAGPFQFKVDTGSTRSAVSEDLVTRLGLAIVAESELITPSGRAVRPLARIERFSVGDARTTSLKALVLPRDQPGARLSVDGLIGQDVLAPLIYTIDYSRQVIIWDGERPHGDPRTRLALQVSDGQVLVSLPQRSANDAGLQFIPDSGADGVVLFARASRPQLGVTPLDIGLLRTLSGHKVVRRVLLDGLRVGDVWLRNQTAVIVQPDRADPRLGDGLLPLHLFARVTFDGPGQYLIVEGRRQRGH